MAGPGNEAKGKPDMKQKWRCIQPKTLEAKTSDVWFPATDNLQDSEIYLCAGGLRHGISTKLKFHDFATKADGVALMPTSHNCEDHVCEEKSCTSIKLCARL